MKETIDLLGKILTNILTALYTWYQKFKESVFFRKLFLLFFVTSMILFRTLLNRNLWMNPLSKVMGGWGIWETVNGEQKLTTECIENVIMMVPFSSVVMWTFKEKTGNGWKKILWYSGKIAFIFSVSMEYINRNYSSFRTQIHEDKDKAINEEYSGNYLVGPRKTLLVDPQKDIDVKYIAIGGVEREDKSIEESHEIVKCKPADNLEIASWNSFVRKLDEYHGHHPVQ